jgi:hypothetical protein
MVLIRQYGIPYFKKGGPPLGKIESENLEKARKKLAALKMEASLVDGQLASLEGQSVEKEALTRERKALAAQIGKLSEFTDQLRDDVIDLSLKQEQYLQAIEAFEASKALLRKMKRQQQEARVAMHTPVHPLIVRQAPD